MTVQWLVIRKSDNSISGWHRDGKGTTIPPDTADKRFILADDTLLGEYRAAEKTAVSRGRISRPLWDDATNKPIVTPDTRPTFRYTINPQLSENAPTQLVVEAINDDLTIDTTYNETLYLDMFTDGDIYRLNFNNGEARRMITPSRSGIHGIFDNATDKTESTVRVFVYK